MRSMDYLSTLLILLGGIASWLLAAEVYPLAYSVLYRPHLNPSLALFFYFCVTVVSAAIGWGLSKIRKRFLLIVCAPLFLVVTDYYRYIYLAVDDYGLHPLARAYANHYLHRGQYAKHDFERMNIVAGQYRLGDAGSYGYVSRQQALLFHASNEMAISRKIAEERGDVSFGSKAIERELCYLSLLVSSKPNPPTNLSVLFAEFYSTTKALQQANYPGVQLVHQSNGSCLFTTAP